MKKIRYIVSCLLFALTASVFISSGYAVPLVIKQTDGTQPTSFSVQITNDYKLSPFKINNVQLGSGVVTTTPMPTLIPYSTPGEGDYSVQFNAIDPSVEVDGEHHYFMQIGYIDGLQGQCLFQAEKKLSWYVEKCAAYVINSHATIYAYVNHV